MVRVKFRYKDQMSNGEGREPECTVSSVDECIRIYGLDTDPSLIDYEIISVTQIN